MQTLANSVDLAEIIERLQSVKAEDRGFWGVMNAPQMLCHLRGAFQVAMGDIPVLAIDVAMPLAVLKAKALWAPALWHKNFETVPLLKIGTPAMQVGSFEVDRADVLAELDRFRKLEQVRVDHSLFGPMSFEDWMRWGYLHTEHHLRQFGR